MSFSIFGLSPQILEAIEAQGYSEPTPIQKKSIPIVLDGKDLMGAAQTGTGKTAGFTLPILERLSNGKSPSSNHVRTLILTPTRELAAQVHDSVKTYGQNLPLSSTVVFGGVGIGPQMQKLRKEIIKQLFLIFNNLHNVDVIHLHSSKAGFLGRVLSRALGYRNKVIHTPHGASFLRKDLSVFKYRLFVFLEQLANKLSANVIACSQSEAKEFRHLGIQAEFVNNGVATFYDDNHSNHSNHSNLTIATIGRICSQKNPALFNEIALSFKESLNIKFIWIGDGELRHLLDAKNITVTGWLTKEEVMVQMNKANIYLSSALWEGLPISVLQAMSLAKPLVLSDCIGNKDLINRNGFLFTDINGAISSIDQLLKNPELRIELGARSKQLMQETFSIEQMVNGYWCWYQKCSKKEVC